MTKAFCHLILHYSVARLSWKTIKSLRRTRHLHTNKKHNYAAPEYEILQGWVILAFHTLYVSLGVEYMVRFIVPFYFHFKIIGLLLTFVLPSWGGRNGSSSTGSEYGLSPVISYLFDYVIVPGIHKIHDLMDNDPKGYAKKQLAMLPLLVIDLFIAPGIFTTDAQKLYARDRISNVGMEKEEDNREDKYDSIPPPEAFIQHDTIDINPLDEQPKSRESKDELQSNASDEVSNTSMKLENEQCISYKTKDDTEQSIEEQSDSFRNVSFIQDSFTRRYEEQKTKESKQQPDDNETIPATPPRKQAESTLFENNETTPTRRSRLSSLTHSSILSPAVKSRLASSARKLKRFSQEHAATLSPKRRHRKEYESLDETKVADSTSDGIIEPPQIVHLDEENEAQTSRRTTRRKGRERLSFGDHFRELVTGDANIRVRDHLFDLETDLPSSPRKRISPRRRTRTSTRDKDMNLSPNITTRT